MNWLEEICETNARFRGVVDVRVLPVERAPCPYAVITCMDPRVNLESVGVLPFAPNGEARSQVRVIRTIGGIHEIRSLVIGIHMAGVQEIAVVMHTDCGCSLAYHHVDRVIDNMKRNLSSDQFKGVKKIVGEPFREKLPEWLKAFQHPGEAVRKEVDAINASPLSLTI